MKSDSIEFDFDTKGSFSSQSFRPPKEKTYIKASEPMNEAVSKELGELNDKLAAFQSEKSEKALMASAFAMTLSSLLRREYFEDSTVPTLRPNWTANINQKNILWMKLTGVGLETGFTPDKAAEALECLLSASHKPGRERLLFLVSGDKETGFVSIHLGIQPVHGAHNEVSASVEVWNGFAKSNWPGLSFEADKNVCLGFTANDYKEAKPGRHPGVRVLTGIPAGRNKETISATIDKLASTLSGRTWRYLVIAEPVESTEIEKIVQVCRELQGRAESLKSFQVGQNINVTDSTTDGVNCGENESESQRDISVGRILLGVAAGAALVYAAPVALSCIGAGAAAAGGVATAATAGGAASAGGASGLLFSLGLGSVLAGAKNKSSGKNWSKTISRSLSESRGVSLSETVANKHAEAAAKLLESHIERLLLSEAVGAWSVGTYFIGENDETADIGAQTLKAILSGDDSCWEPIRICEPRWRRGQSDDVLPLVALEHFDNPNFVPMTGDVILRHPLGSLFDSLQTLLNTRELVRMANFPLSNIPGIPVRRIAADTGLRNPDDRDGKSNIVLGNQIYRGQELDRYFYSFDKALLAKHALVCGINGSGKTNTILGVLGDLLQKETPFLVIEPAKQEYVDWAIRRNGKIIKKYKGDKKKAKADPFWVNVYIPGRKKWKGEDLSELTLNPFDFVWLNAKEKPKVLEHIDRLKTIINAALPMQESLPILMEELIFSVYSVPGNDVNARKCWLPGSQPPGFPRYDTPTFEEGESFDVPTFVQMASKVDRVIERFNYAKEATMNLRAALKARIESFKRGWRMELLNKASPRKSAKEWNELFNRPTVINLTSLTSDEDKAFFMAVILMFVYEYRQELSELNAEEVADVAPGIPADGLRSLLVIEEAHRVLGRSEGPVAAFAAAPRQKVSEMFSNMISEVRAYGQGILIADQIPGRLNEDAVKNTNLKIVHKLVSADDRQSMATALNLWDDQERIISDLKVGEALVRCDMDDEAYMVKVKKCDSEESDSHNMSANVSA